MLFVIFGVGFLMCLFGGLLIGMYVDCVGCKLVVVFMLWLMGLLLFVFVVMFIYV